MVDSQKTMQSNLPGGLLHFKFADVISLNALKNPVGKYYNRSYFINEEREPEGCYTSWSRWFPSWSTWKEQKQCLNADQLQIWNLTPLQFIKRSQQCLPTGLNLGSCTSHGGSLIGFYLKINSVQMVLQKETQYNWELQVSQLWIKTLFPQILSIPLWKVGGRMGFITLLIYLWLIILFHKYKTFFPALHVTQLSSGESRNKQFLSKDPWEIIFQFLQCDSDT